MNLEQRYIDKLKDLNGTLPNGKPKLRIVTPSEAVHPHGQLKGVPKYADPVSGKQMPFLILEQWLPPDFAGSKETYNYELLGVHPSDCLQDCCMGGVWGCYMLLTNQYGQYLPFTDTVMAAIERHISLSRQYAELTAKERLDALDADLAAAEQKQAEIARLESNNDLEHYFNHKKELDNADNRVTIGLGKNALPEVKGGKMPIGNPLEQLI